MKKKKEEEAMVRSGDKFRRSYADGSTGGPFGDKDKCGSGGGQRYGQRSGDKLRRSYADGSTGGPFGDKDICGSGGGQSRRFPTVFEPSEAPIEAARREWDGLSVVVRSLGRRVPAEWVAKDVATRGRLAGKVEAVPLADDHLALRFGSTADRDRALNGGPWVVAGQLLAMEPWMPEFVPGEVAVKMAAVWLRLPRLPPEYWSAATILEIATQAGRPLAVDGVTEQRRAMGFARVKLAIDATEPLLPGVLIRGKTRVRWQPFVFENIGDYCTGCGRVGHSVKACCHSAPEQSEEVGVDLGASQIGPEMGTGEVDQGLIFGPWLVANRPRLPRGPPPPPSPLPRPGKTAEPKAKVPSPRPLSPEDRASSPVIPPLDRDGWQKPTKIARRHSPLKTPMEGEGDGAPESHRSEGMGPASSHDVMEPETVGRERLGSPGALSVPGLMDTIEDPARGASTVFWFGSPPQVGERPRPETSLAGTGVIVYPPQESSPGECDLGGGAHGAGGRALVSHLEAEQLAQAAREGVPRGDSRETSDDRVAVAGTTSTLAVDHPTVVQRVRAAVMRAVSGVSEDDEGQRRLEADWESYAIDSQGLSGGILVLWKRGVASVDVFHNCPQQVIMIITEPDAAPWVLCGVYASTDYRNRRVLWDEITNLVVQGFPTMVIGDFNCILSASEKRGGRPFTDTVDRREFWNFVSQNGLVDLGFSGPRFTWCNNQSGMTRVWERIDRAIASPDWIIRFPTYQVRHLSRIASDHCPLLLSTVSDTGHHSPFRFEKVWLSYPQSWDIVREAWSLPVHGNAMQRVSRKLELTKRRLRRWNREVVGDIFRKMEVVEAAISNLQSREDQEGELPEADMISLRGLLADHHSLLRQHEVFWRQKFRVQWIREGDRNTSFFHRTTVIRRQRSMIRSLQDGTGRQVEGEAEVSQVLLDFFRSRWTEDRDLGDVGQLPRADTQIGMSKNALLVRHVTGEEVQEAVWALAGDKAPGPDGFPPFFFRRY
ncbi:uncharacterized protein LOC120110982 [Phoenix dactylifera]|uniref:Uncharacterized protein LOC120110982 n=1 Tax=Phoenix dactylifera TaxID=42345 RepID=A0A8B9A8M5_PHODC|nr:uncharacterized protein LOC120110982 [Phoenix dactylifera]